MGKKEFKKEIQESPDQAPEMSSAEARAYRTSLYKPAAESLTEEDKRDKFRVFWAQQKYKYGKSKDLEEILWLHLKAVKMSEPEKFEDGLAHFGLKKIR
jgi:hypothetical protein